MTCTAQQWQEENQSAWVNTQPFFSYVHVLSTLSTFSAHPTSDNEACKTYFHYTTFESRKYINSMHSYHNQLLGINPKGIDIWRGPAWGWSHHDFSAPTWRPGVPPYSLDPSTTYMFTWSRDDSKWITSSIPTWPGLHHIDRIPRHGIYIYSHYRPKVN